MFPDKIHKGSVPMLSGEHKYDRNYVAIVTPFKPGQEKVDEEGLRRLVRYFTEDKRFMEQGLGSIDINPALRGVAFP